MKKNINYTKMFVIFLSMLFSLSLFSCKCLRNYIYMQQIHTNDGDFGNLIIQCINDKDETRLSELFCDKVKNTEYLKKQISFLYDYINKNGDTKIDVNGLWQEYGGRHRAFNGGRIVIDCTGKKYNSIIQIGDKKYNLYYGIYITLIGHKEYEGITDIGLNEILDTSVIKSNVDNKMIYDGGNQVKYLGISICEFNTLLGKYENVMPNELYDNNEYKYTYNDLEKGHSKW